MIIGSRAPRSGPRPAAEVPLGREPRSPRRLAGLLRIVFPDDLETEKQPTGPTTADSDLRRARDARCWTSARLNYELHRLTRARGVAIASPASLRVLISQWENGAQLPDARYRELLNAVLDISPSTPTLPLSLTLLESWFRPAGCRAPRVLRQGRRGSSALP